MEYSQGLNESNSKKGLLINCTNLYNMQKAQIYNNIDYFNINTPNLININQSNNDVNYMSNSTTVSTLTDNISVDHIKNAYISNKDNSNDPNNIQSMNLKQQWPTRKLHESQKSNKRSFSAKATASIISASTSLPRNSNFPLVYDTFALNLSKKDIELLDNAVLKNCYNTLCILDISYNKLRDISSHILKCKNLTTLKLDHNEISSICDNIYQLSLLQYLSLSYNNIIKIPDTISLLKNLCYLNISHNHIEFISNTICNLSNLKILHINNNNLLSIPCQFHQLTKLSEISLEWFKYAYPILDITQHDKDNQNNNIYKLFELCKAFEMNNVNHQINFDEFIEYFSNFDSLFNKEQYYKNLLCEACIQQEIGIIKYLIQTKPFLINQPDNDKQTLLSLALYHQKYKSAIVLLNYGANPNLDDGIYGSPLHIAISQLQLDIVKLLIKNGANINAEDQDGNTPLHILFTLFSKDYVKASELANIILIHGGNPNSKNKDNWAPIHLAIRKGQKEGIKWIISHNCKLEAIDPKYFDLNLEGGLEQWTPFHLASSLGHVEILSCLFDGNIDVNKITKNGKTARDICINSLVISKLVKKYETIWLYRQIFNRSQDCKISFYSNNCSKSGLSIKNECNLSFDSSNNINETSTFNIKMDNLNDSSLRIKPTKSIHKPRSNTLNKINKSKLTIDQDKSNSNIQYIMNPIRHKKETDKNSIVNEMKKIGNEEFKRYSPTDFINKYQSPIAITNLNIQNGFYTQNNNNPSKSIHNKNLNYNEVDEINDKDRQEKKEKLVPKCSNFIKKFQMPQYNFNSPNNNLPKVLSAKAKIQGDRRSRNSFSNTKNECDKSYRNNYHSSSVNHGSKTESQLNYIDNLSKINECLNQINSPSQILLSPSINLINPINKFDAKLINNTPLKTHSQRLDNFDFEISKYQKILLNNDQNLSERLKNLFFLRIIHMKINQSYYRIFLKDLPSQMVPVIQYIENELNVNSSSSSSLISNQKDAILRLFLFTFENLDSIYSYANMLLKYEISYIFGYSAFKTADHFLKNLANNVKEKNFIKDECTLARKNLEMVCLEKLQIPITSEYKIDNNSFHDTCCNILNTENDLYKNSLSENLKTTKYSTEDINTNYEETQKNSVLSSKNLINLSLSKQILYKHTHPSIKANCIQPFEPSMNQPKDTLNTLNTEKIIMPFDINHIYIEPFINSKNKNNLNETNERMNRNWKSIYLKKNSQKEENILEEEERNAMPRNKIKKDRGSKVIQ